MSVSCYTILDFRFWSHSGLGVSRHSLQRGEPAHRGGSPSGRSGVILDWQTLASQKF
jgi:hypothetical protein